MMVQTLIVEHYEFHHNEHKPSPILSRQWNHQSYMQLLSIYIYNFNSSSGSKHSQVHEKMLRYTKTIMFLVKCLKIITNVV